MGINEEITKALPVLLAGLILRRFRSVKLDVRMWMFLGTIAGLTFGVSEAALYTSRDILIIFGVSIPAILHALNDWSAGAFNSYWPPIIVQAFSLLFFLGYTMSAASIERRVRTTPMFRGESMLMEVISQPEEKT